MSFSLSLCSNIANWNQFAEDSPQGSVFYSTNFLDALGETYLLYFVIENNSPIAAFALLMSDSQPLPSPYPFTCYQGIMFSSEIEKMYPHRRVLYKLKIVEHILYELTKQHPAVSFCLHPAFEDLRPFLWFNYHEPSKGQFKIDLRYTGILDLQTPKSHDEYLPTVRSVRRQEYVRAAKEGISVEDSTNVEVLDKLHELTFQRQNIDRPSNEIRLLKSIAKQSITNNFGKLKIARTPAGEVASAILCLYDNRCAYYFIAANHPDLRKTFASTFLLFNIINVFREQGIPYFDFVGLNSPNRGDYKMSFNPQPEAYYTVKWPA